MEICSKDTVSPGLIKFGFSSFVLSKILRGVFPIMFQPPGLSKEYILQNPQKFVSQYIHPDTPYTDLLVFHQIGAGKTEDWRTTGWLKKIFNLF